MNILPTVLISDSNTKYKLQLRKAASSSPVPSSHAMCPLVHSGVFLSGSAGVEGGEVG